MNHSALLLVRCLCVVAMSASFASADDAVTLTGRIIDSATGDIIPARLYITSATGEAYFAASADEAGSAITYNVERAPTSFERHVTLSAHPFEVELPPGTYTLLAERGKEYLPAQMTVEITDDPVEIELAMTRWINMAEPRLVFGRHARSSHIGRLAECDAG